MIPTNDLSISIAAIRKDLEQAIARVLDSGWLALGQEVAAFEQEFATYCGTDWCIGVGNGTDALEIALRALGIQAGDEVITAANCGLYSTVAIRAIGATPVYADVSRQTMLIDPESVSGILSDRTRCVVATHLFGRLAELEKLKETVAGHDIKILEDCAQAHGASRNGVRAGAAGDIAAFSFYPTKNLGALGDGGAVVTSDEELARRVIALRQYGWTKKYQATVSGGRNSRLDEIQAAVLRAKLPHLDAMNAARAGIAKRYGEEIDNQDVELPTINSPEHVAHLYVIKTRAREDLQRHLASAGVRTEVHYPLLDYQQAIMAKDSSTVRLRNSEVLATQVLSLPCFPEMTEQQVSTVVAHVNDWRPTNTNTPRLQGGK